MKQWTNKWIDKSMNQRMNQWMKGRDSFPVCFTLHFPTISIALLRTYIIYSELKTWVQCRRH